MPRNMVIGKLKYLIGPASGLYSHPLWTLFSCGHMRVQEGHDPASYRGVDSCSWGGWPWSTTRKERGKVTWAKRDVDPHACVLGLPGQVNKFNSNRLLLTVWDCLTLLPHRVKSERWWWRIWLVGWWNINVSHHVCYWIDAHLEWLIELEFGS